MPTTLKFPDMPIATSTPIPELKLIEGGLGVDDRGIVTFINGFGFEGVKRFYLVQNHTSGFVRAWHAHKKEGKFVIVIHGAALVGAVRVDDMEHPDPQAHVERFVLSSARPSVLAIPSGYANGAMTLTEDTIIAYFSTLTIEESRGDDFRFQARMWDIWNVEER